MATIRTLRTEDHGDEAMCIDNHHVMGRSRENRSIWVYWDTHVSHVCEVATLITDDFGNLCPVQQNNYDHPHHPINRVPSGKPV